MRGMPYEDDEHVLHKKAHAHRTADNTLPCTRDRMYPRLDRDKVHLTNMKLRYFSPSLPLQPSWPSCPATAFVAVATVAAFAMCGMTACTAAAQVLACSLVAVFACVLASVALEGPVALVSASVAVAVAAALSVAHPPWPYDPELYATLYELPSRPSCAWPLLGVP